MRGATSSRGCRPLRWPLETLRVVHERSLQLEQRSTGPAGLLGTLGAVLERYPQVYIEQLEWKLVSAGAPLAANALAPVGVLPPVEARLVVQARLPSEYSASQRSALELVDALAIDLGRDSGHSGAHHATALRPRIRSGAEGRRAQRTCRRRQYASADAADQPGDRTVKLDDLKKIRGSALWPS
jgi:hypothetical protein